MTLIELMVTIAVFAVILGIAVPNLTQFLVSNRLTSQINELVGDISRARNEAGTRGTNVSICIAASATACATSGTAWEVGRIIFADSNSDGVIASTTDIIKYVPALDGGTNLSSDSFASTYFITFRPYGGLTSSAVGTFKLCDPNSTTGRILKVSPTGRPLARKIPNATDTETCP